MEPGSGRSRCGAAAARSGGVSKRRTSSAWAGGSINSLGTDILCAVFALLDHYDLVRCSIVCKSWNNTIYSSSLMRDLYFKMHPHLKQNSVKSAPSNMSMKIYLEELAMEEHQSGLMSGSAKVHQWSGYNGRVHICRMRRGSVITSDENKDLRLWSAESCSLLGKYSVPQTLVDLDFDENKIVGLTSSRLCIWKRNGQGGLFQSPEGIFTRSLCMSYIDPEAAIGCEDGRVRIFDMYSGRCSRIIRMHSGAVTCLTLSNDQLILGGSTFGNVAIADLSTGERMGYLKSSFSPTGMKSLSFNSSSYTLFAGSTSGYAHCWDLRTMRPLWETRVSPNVVYAVHHLPNDTSSLAVGGLDGILRILNQRSGEILSSMVVDAGRTAGTSKDDNQEVMEKRFRVRRLQENTRIDSIPKHVRPPITCLSVGMNKIVTTHNEKFIRMWRFPRNT